MGKPEGKRRSVRPRCRWENKKWNLNVKLCIRKKASFAIKWGGILGYLKIDKLLKQVSAPRSQFNNALFVSQKVTVTQYSVQTWRFDGRIFLLPASWLRVWVLPPIIITTNLPFVTSCQSSPHVTLSLSLSLSLLSTILRTSRPTMSDKGRIFTWYLTLGVDIETEFLYYKRCFGCTVMNRWRRCVHFVILSGKSEYYPNRKQQLSVCYRS